jgi:hypothetical protein
VLAFILDGQAVEVRLEQAFTEAFREHVGGADIWAGEDYADACAT